MRKLPILTVIVAVCYFLSPLAILVHNSVSKGLSFFSPYALFTALSFSDTAILILYPLSGFALLSVKKWGRYLYFGCATALIAYNAGACVFHPRYSLLVAALVNIALVVLAGAAFQRRASAPYFNPLLRWWETETKYRVEAFAQIKVGEAVVSGEILDISRSGCFATFVLDLNIGETYRMHVKCLTHSLEVDGKIVRRALKSEPHDGYGIMFSKTTREQEKEIGRIIEELERGDLRDFVRENEMIPSGVADKNRYRGVTETEPRYHVYNRAILSSDEDSFVCRIVGISRAGCFIQTDRELPEGATFLVNIQCMKSKFTADGRVERKSAHDGRKEYGVRFLTLRRRKRRELHTLLDSLKRIGA